MNILFAGSSKSSSRILEFLSKEKSMKITGVLTQPDKRGEGNQIFWNYARFFEYTGTNAFSRIQKVPILQDRFRAKTRRFPTYQDLAVTELGRVGGSRAGGVGFFTKIPNIIK